jgi:hypothetical protein
LGAQPVHRGWIDISARCDANARRMILAEVD